MSHTLAALPAKTCRHRFITGPVPAGGHRSQLRSDALNVLRRNYEQILQVVHSVVPHAICLAGEFVNDDMFRAVSEAEADCVSTADQRPDRLQRVTSAQRDPYPRKVPSAVSTAMRFSPRSSKVSPLAISYSVPLAEPNNTS